VGSYQIDWRARLGADRLTVATARNIPRIALWIAITGSVIVAVLASAAALGIWMEGANLHPTPRINAFTVGLGIVPIPVLAWIVYLWVRTRPDGFLDIALRIVISVALAVGAYYCFGIAMFAAYFVG
jgi:hypothetical protein